MSTEPPRKNTLTYADAGVSIDAGNALVERIKPAVAATMRAGVVGGIGGFGGLFDLKAAGLEDALLVAATDGVGTKLRIAIDVGDVSGVGVDLVAMCVNDLLCQGAEPLFFLDYLATGKLEPGRGAEIVESVARGCAEAGCALLGGETAEMPGMYSGEDFDLAGFAVGAVGRAALLPKPCAEGDVIIGLPSSGPHSNGYSLIRKVVETAGLDWADPAPFAEGQILGQTLGAALLTPTRIYIRQMLPLLGPHQVSALAHITGGGLSENVPRVLPEGMAAEINLSAWTSPPVFRWLSETGGVAAAEMLRAFNCGIGLCVVAPEAEAEGLLAALNGAGEAALRIGHVVARGDGPAVVYSGSLFE